MTELFRGWRRKAGVLTLVLSCVFMGGWLRSQICSDLVSFGGREGQRFYCLRTYRNCLVWETAESEFDKMVRPGWSFVIGLLQIDDQFGNLGDYRWRRNWYEFDFGEKYFEQTCLQRTYWSVPYWSIVSPLTVISFWLLLPKPSKSN